VLITPWSTNPKTTLDANTNQPKKYVFRACFIDPFQGGVLAKFALES
jgi:branched-chain amino acid transport system substrate-binding protein